MNNEKLLFNQKIHTIYCYETNYKKKELIYEF